MTAYRDFEPNVRLKGVVALSPDSSQVAYIDDASGQFNLMIQARRGGEPKQLTRFSNSTVSWIAWRPDGNSLFFMADKEGDEQNQLYEVRSAGGEPRPVTDNPAALFVEPFGKPFAPDGRRISYVGNDRDPRVSDVLVRDTATDEVTRYPIPGVTGGLMAGYWSPTGEQLTVVDCRGGSSDHVLYLLSTTDGTAVRLNADTGATYWPGPWLPDGSGFLIRSNEGRDFTGLAVFNIREQALQWLDTPDWDVENVQLSADGRLLLWCLNVDGATQLKAKVLDTDQPIAAPTLPPGQVTAIDLTADGGEAVLLLTTPTRPTNLAALTLDTGALRWLSNAAPVSADTRTFVEPTAVRYTSRDGLEVSALLYRPQTQAQVPVVLAIHGGPGIQERPTYAHDGLFQYLVSKGVAVFVPNARGSTGYGYSYQKLTFRDWGGGDLHDFAAAADYLRAQPWADPDRIALVGRSYGGFAVLSCVARLPEYNWAAAVAWCGPSNLITFTKASPPTWRSKVATLIGDYETDAEFLLSRSPVTYADQIRTPLLIIQGANDTRVPKHESDQIVAKLQRRGVDVTYEVYPDEGHIFGKRENQTRARSSAAEFLLTYLRYRLVANATGPD